MKIVLLLEDDFNMLLEDGFYALNENDLVFDLSIDRTNVVPIGDRINVVQLDH